MNKDSRKGRYPVKALALFLALGLILAAAAPGPDEAPAAFNGAR